MAVLRDARRVLEGRKKGLRLRALTRRDPLAGGIGSVESDRDDFPLGHKGTVFVSGCEGSSGRLNGGFDRADVGGESLLKVEPRIDAEYGEFKSTFREHGENLQGRIAGGRDLRRMLPRELVFFRREGIKDEADHLSSPVLVDKVKIIELHGR